jgi:hypothetical protein
MKHLNRVILLTLSLGFFAIVLSFVPRHPVVAAQFHCFELPPRHLTSHTQLLKRFRIRLFCAIHLASFEASESTALAP